MTKLKKGDQSPNPTPTTIKKLLAKSGNKCAAPDCENLLVTDDTIVGQCAHIIPKVVGGVREDWSTPLEDRRKEPNLLYLCGEHHPRVDNRENEKDYTAKVLRTWKSKHETRVAEVMQHSASLLPAFRDIFATVMEQYTEDAHISNAIIERLLNSCHEFLNRYLIGEARAILNLLITILLDVDNDELKTRAKLLGAILLIRTEQIPQAKQELLHLIEEHPHNIDARLEYIELCDSFLEPDDELARIERMTRELAGDHPRLHLIDLARKYRTAESIDTSDLPDKWVDDTRLNASYMCQYALFCDLNQEFGTRDSLISLWQDALPTSARPHLLRVVFRVGELTRSSTQDFAAIQDAIEFSKQERERVSKKDPMSLRDQLTWLMQELMLELTLFSVTGNLGEAEEITNKALSVIEQCYFGNFIYSILPDLLGNVFIASNNLSMIIKQIQKSNVEPTKSVIELVFWQALHHDDLYTQLQEFTDQFAQDTLSHILSAYKDRNVQLLAERINSLKNSEIAITFLSSINEPNLLVELTELLEVDAIHRRQLIYIRAQALAAIQRDNEAINLITDPELELDHANPIALTTIGNIVYRNARWDILVPIMLQLLKFDIPVSNHTKIHLNLAEAYFYQGDDSNAIEHARFALENSEELQIDDRSFTLHMLGEALLNKGLADEACADFQRFEKIERPFPLLILEARAYLKSNVPNKYEVVSQLILRAFEEADTYDDKLFRATGNLFVELGNADIISIEDEPLVEDGLFIQLDGFRDGWFYIGQEEYLGATCIQRDTDKYEAVIHKSVSEPVEWPADRYANTTRNILHIATPLSYLSWRANEAWINEASVGSEAIQMIQVPRENGVVNWEYLIQFLEDESKPINEFFETYVNSSLPFSFLCQRHGSLPRAMGQISSQRRGFIYCNDDGRNISEQNTTAHAVLRGEACYIGGLSALMLAQADLIQDVVNNVPNLHVPTSVIRLLRTLAGEFDLFPSSIGGLGFVDGTLTFIPRNEAQEEKFRNQLLRAADALDDVSLKVIGKTYPEINGERNLDHVVPNYFVDAFRYAQERRGHILTDDARLIVAYQHYGESSLPKQFSSLSLVRALTEKGHFAWDTYFKYFSLLSNCRYRFLQVSVDDMILAILPSTESGLITSAPHNIDLLDLPLTLSQEYGVDRQVAIGVLSTFFIRLIEDVNIPLEVAEENFARTILQAFVGRDKKIMPKEVFQRCQAYMANKILLNQASIDKLENLRKQLFGFARGGLILL